MSDTLEITRYLIKNGIGCHVNKSPDIECYDDEIIIDYEYYIQIAYYMKKPLILHRLDMIKGSDLRLSHLKMIRNL